MKGLISGHAYSLICVRKVKAGEKTIKMVKVRNPHGQTEWTGRWSDKSDAWAKHPGVKKELLFKPKEDGSFWMTYKEFLHFFGTVSVCKKSMPIQGCHEDHLRAIQ